MAKGSREIRRKIKSTKSTRQITKAMELVSASKMRRAIANTLALRPYAQMAELMVRRLATAMEHAKKTDKTEFGDTAQVALHPLLEKREVKKVLVVVVSTDRGLCGGLNSQLQKKVAEYVRGERSKQQPPELEFIAVGKKAQDFLRRMELKVVAAYNALSNHPKIVDTYPISRMILADYEHKKYDKVMLLYTDFISALTQKPAGRRLLPLSEKALEEMIEGLETHNPHAHAQNAAAEKKAVETADEYVFEPSPQEVLDSLLPKLTEMQVYQAILEATASEHAARMFAMRNASDNAKELISDFTLLYNRIRQAAVTAELAEISAGRAALG